MEARGQDASETGNETDKGNWGQFCKKEKKGAAKKGNK